MKMRVKVCHFTSVHPKDDIRIFHKECRSLAASGFDVALIVPDAGIGALIDGVTVKVIAPIRHRFKRMLWMPVLIFLQALREKAAIYHFHDPELLPVGMLLKLLGRAVIYDAHEDVPEDIMIKAYIPARLRRLVAFGVGATEQAGARRFTRVIAATAAIARKFPLSKTEIIQNFPIRGELGPNALALGDYARRARKIIYVGAITRIRGASEMVAAMDIVNHTTQATLVLAGRFEDDALKRELQNMPGWRHVEYRGLLNRSDLASAMGECRAGVVLFRPGPNHDESQPNKLFEYMSAGLPLIASNFPLWSDLISKVQCGIVVDPRDPDAIARETARLLDDEGAAEKMGERGLAAIKDSFNWEAEAGKLSALYSAICGSHDSANF